MATGKIKIIEDTAPVEGISRVDINDLSILDTGAKVHSINSLYRLEENIVQHGFAFPFIVWKGSQNYIVDGVARFKVVQRMIHKKKDYRMPSAYPVNFVSFDSEEEARKSIFLLNHSYARPDIDSFWRILERVNFVREDMGLYAIPTVDLWADCRRIAQFKSYRYSKLALEYGKDEIKEYRHFSHLILTNTRFSSIEEAILDSIDRYKE